MPGFELIGSEEKQQVIDIFENGSGVLFRHGFESLRNNSFKVKEFEKNFSEKFKTENALACSSGTAALRIALAALNIKREDEVITQTFTFVATVEAIVESGAIPICVDVNRSLNIDINSLKKAITPRTKAIIAVHMLGYPADLFALKDLCDERGIALIEDTAWGCGGDLAGRFLGTVGNIGCFSFDYAKTITTGEGGMLLFNGVESHKFFQHASAYHDHGHENNPMVPRWEDTRSGGGFNYRMSELQGAVGIAQLEKLTGIVDAQRAIARKISNILEKYSEISFVQSPEGANPTYDGFVFFVESPAIAKMFRSKLLEIGISTKILPEAMTWHFSKYWTHLPTLVNTGNSCNSSNDILSRAVSIPVSLKADDSYFDKLELVSSRIFKGSK